MAAYTAYGIYAKYFETAEIRELTAFFDSATGRKLTAQAPAILVVQPPVTPLAHPTIIVPEGPRDGHAGC